MFGAVAVYQLDGQSTVSTADAAFFGAITGHLVVLTFRCAARGAIPFPVLETEGECKEWLPNWSTSGWDIQCGGNWS